MFDTNTNTAAGLSVAKTGLVMNNCAVNASRDNGDSTSDTLNIVEIENVELTDWHEF